MAGVTIATNHGTYTGRTVDTIVRREYGRKAVARRSADPNSPHWGMVTHTDRHGTHVDATIKWVEGAPPEHRMVFHGHPGWVQWVTCPCHAGWMSSAYSGEEATTPTRSGSRTSDRPHTGPVILDIVLDIW